ncbi:LLM class flavin-dependent oxidoreductase [Kineosporia mesophila]|uniref:LLM class flavin-dependent oxidoreductase n=1 Tax=Kineosporia mesophila TaxID=566012 RepID=A0ABP7ABZ4_9ACTN|nr:LLM class flavin-dependent oxidoreductase [Kineosporia mesophila]
MKIGIGLPNQVRGVHGQELTEWAVRAEQAGFSSLGTVGRISYPGIMDTVALTAAASVTRRIGLLSNVLIAPAWPPALLAKELAGIDAISGHRLTVGVGVSRRPDDFTSPELTFAGRGRRFDRDLDVYQDVWNGKPLGEHGNSWVTGAGRAIPLLMGGMAPAALDRMARWGEGYISASVPPHIAAATYDAARSAWSQADRTGAPKIVAISYFNFADEERGRANVHHYYLGSPPDLAALISGSFPARAEALRQRVADFRDLGVDELIFNPTLPDIHELDRLAEIVL